MAQDVRNSEQNDAIDNTACHSQDELRQWFILDQIPDFGIGRLNKLQTHFNISPSNLLNCNSSELKDLGFNAAQVNAIVKPDMRQIEKEFAWLDADQKHFAVYPGHPDFPELLSEIARPPLLLFGWGNKDLLKSTQIAVVGSRNPSQYGKNCGFELAQQLAQQGVSITSGLAMGVDANAHQGALSAGGRTIAVLGSGLNNLYPKRNIPLAHQIIQNQGLILSEFRAHTKPLAHNFPRRNRIVSGLSLGVLVIEAAIRSGSLITAKYALEQNREVFAIPGNINNPLNEGAHLLIKQGAKLVSNLEDILEEFQNVNSCVLKDSSKKCEKSVIQCLATDKLLDSVDHDVTALDVVIQRSKMPIEVVLAQLLEYELRGLVAPVSGGYIKLRGK
ncbi:DNA-processing protein DprA [Aliiglaciecola lipolytica]|uniref:DNA processing protein n=1 Tax=Aliiglaciecola lipolytica E3 TaxID=1127673 RepID=K6XM10_9ALTE|nr:DNA-processing protein DprA [Aliiglaciecola lipolytica]GAC12706.1 DNA processing protein [Aliiglaciecola lipolytica E3]